MAVVNRKLQLSAPAASATYLAIVTTGEVASVASPARELQIDLRAAFTNDNWSSGDQGWSVRRRLAVAAVASVALWGGLVATGVAIAEALA